VAAFDAAARRFASVFGVRSVLVILPRVDRGSLSMLLSNASGPGLVSVLHGTSVAKLAASIDALVNEANAKAIFRRGALLRQAVPERLGLAAIDRSRTIAIVASARERYVAIEAAGLPAIRLNLGEWLGNVRLAGRRAVLGRALQPLQLAPGAPSALDSIAGSEGAAAVGSAWATAVTNSLAGQMTWSVVVRCVRRVIMVAGLGYISVSFVLDIRREVAALVEKRRRWHRWRQLVREHEEGRLASALSDECMVCLAPLSGAAGGAASEPATPVHQLSGGVAPGGSSSVAALFGGGASLMPPSHFPQSSRTTVVCLCGHVFHDACARTWLREHNTCPLCRVEDPLPTAPPPGLEAQAPDEGGSAADESSTVQDHAGGMSCRVKRVVLTLRIIAAVVAKRLRDHLYGAVGCLRRMTARERLLLLRLLVSDWTSLLSALVSLARLLPMVAARLQAMRAVGSGATAVGAGLALFETYA
jgi:hypothetical protein